MQVSPLQLEGYFLKELQFSLVDELKVFPDRAIKYDHLDINIDFTAEPLESNPLKWRCEVTVESKNDPKLKLPYTFRITFVGFFEVNKHYPEERADLMARTNAPALLYSAAREALVPLTGRGPLPALLLPSITFLPVSTQAVSAQRKSSQRTSKKASVKRASKESAAKKSK